MGGDTLDESSGSEGDPLWRLGSKEFNNGRAM